jgi:crotonobetainyl-CoA:carnitine CoA-transferase CaiB-like acyl-CoA transferase
VSGALSGIRVLEVASHLSGPYAGMLLADHGADVVKVEPPGGGDDSRDMPPFVNGESAPFTMWNRNKRSVQLDLKNDEGKRRFCELADQCDVVVENFRVGTLDRLGVGWKVLNERNPRLIYAAVSGFGRTGPD